ncbi:MAG TPA: malto-oligosyltrehalose trehalohydrolase [Nocardioidaceae bacterium]|nr:malto-oligosyltrehalose trehalohydrolase [Nocardioidaceae bacterium]
MTLSVWAPSASGVDVVVDGTGTPMVRAERGWWSAPSALGVGTRYRFSLDGGEPRADPRALRLPAGPDGEAEVFDPSAFGWTDHGWAGVELSTAVIYEMHVGTFTAQGTFDAAVGRLDHLASLGVDLVEVMPVASFPGRNGWGYDGVGLYAVHEPYGGPAGFQRFVDACHARGLGVCLDVVYNHLGPSGNHLAEFGPYFTDEYHTPWGQAVNLDGPGSDEVRGFLLGNALMWLRDFHVDALRLDAVHALYDARAVTVLEQMSADVDALAAEVGRPLWLIAESDRNDPATVTPRGDGGLGVHAQWADDVHHAWHVLLTGEDQGYYADFAASTALTKATTGIFVHDGGWSSFRERSHGRPVDRAVTPGWRFVVSLQTHDQVGNRAVGDRLSASLDVGQLACGAALLLTSAGTPMLFMGEEWGASTPWQYFTDHTDPELAEAVRQGRRSEFASHGWSFEDVPDPQDPATVGRSRLHWGEVSDGDHGRLLAWYRNLIQLRRSRADLHDGRLDRVQAQHDHAAGTVVIRRGDDRVAVNVGAEQAELSVGGAAQLLLAWDPESTRLDGDVLRLPPHSAAVLGPQPA